MAFINFGFWRDQDRCILLRARTFYAGEIFHFGQSSRMSTGLSAFATIMGDRHDGKDQHSLLQEDSHRAMNIQVYSFEAINALLTTRQLISLSEFLEDVLRVDDY